MSGRKYDVIRQNGDCSRKRNVRTSVFRKRKSVIEKQRHYRTRYGKYPSSHNAIRRWLKLRIVAAIETVTPQLLENTWMEIEYRLDILRVKKRAR
jgi:hypothetical protein